MKGNLIDSVNTVAKLKNTSHCWTVKHTVIVPVEMKKVYFTFSMESSALSLLDLDR